MWINN